MLTAAEYIEFINELIIFTMATIHNATEIHFSIQAQMNGGISFHNDFVILIREKLMQHNKKVTASHCFFCNDLLYKTSYYAQENWDENKKIHNI